MIHEPLAAPQALADADADADAGGGAPARVTAVGGSTATIDGEPGTGAGRAPAPLGLGSVWPRVHHPDVPSSGAVALRARMVRIDAVVIALTWAAVLVLGPDRERAALPSAAVLVLVVVATLVVLAALQLYRARISAVRRVARRRLALAALVAPTVLVATGTVSRSTDGWATWLATGAVAAAIGLIVGREVFEQWLRSARARGHHVRPIVVGGTHDEVLHVVRLLEAHPEVGCRAVAWIGPTPIGPPAPELALVPRLGDPAGAGEAADLVGAAGLLFAPSVAGDRAFGELARSLQARRLHVQVAAGLWGIDPARLRTAPLAHEPCFYLEPLRQGSASKRIKRAADVVVASLLLIITAPILLTAALAVKLHDGGPVIFRQVRVGLGGSLFELHKLRTMRVDAERLLDDLVAQNERSGPLFKIGRDPRVTPIGRVLRATSIDELPQLWDVLAGRLSLVGPRPALPDEVAAFDAPLLERHRVLPGVTGLWQVEARHNPSFDAYRHLDLFYVENWTLGLDIAILAATVKTVLTDAAGAVADRRRAADAEVAP